MASDLSKAIVTRLAQLAEDDTEHCACCGYRLIAPDWCICSACLTNQPIYNQYFRTEEDARLAWLCLQVGLHPDSEDGEHLPVFPMDRALPQHGNGLGISPIARMKELDLASVADRFTELQQLGNGDYRGRCPLHQERTPSFHIYTQSQRWRCFGACATGGDVVDLLKRLREKDASRIRG